MILKQRLDKIEEEARMAGNQSVPTYSSALVLELIEEIRRLKTELNEAWKEGQDDARQAYTEGAWAERERNDTWY